MALLTHDELRDLTDCARRADQIEWLRKRGWVFDIGETGRPKVDRAEYERHMIGGTPASPREELMMRHISRLERKALGLQKSNARWRSRLRVYPLDQLRGLPFLTGSISCSGVYFLWRGPLLYYIGQSRYLGYRYSQHARAKRFTHATFLPFHKDWNKHCEEDHVVRYQPPGNRTSHG